MQLHWSRAEIASWAIAIIGIAIMGLLVLHGPFHNINKTQAQSAFPLAHVKIVTATGARSDQIGIYQPSTITVHVGQQVAFANVSNNAHTVTDSNNAFDSGFLDTNHTWVYTATKAGTYHYFCQYHSLMHGTLVVK